MIKINWILGGLFFGCFCATGVSASELLACRSWQLRNPPSDFAAKNEVFLREYSVDLEQSLTTFDSAFKAYRGAFNQCEDRIGSSWQGECAKGVEVYSVLLAKLLMYSKKYPAVFPLSYTLDCKILKRLPASFVKKVMSNVDSLSSQKLSEYPGL